MIMPDSQARRDAGRKGAELPSNAFPRPRSGCPGRRMEADAFEHAMIDGHKDGRGALLQCDGAGGIGTPHLIRALGRDCPILELRAQDPRGATKRLACRMSR